MEFVYENINVIAAILTFAFVAVGILFWIGQRNTNLENELRDLEQRKTAVMMLKSAIKYLEPFGTGGNLEYTNAREILEVAMTRVLYEKPLTN